jgi:hypothetical protein
MSSDPDGTHLSANILESIDPLFVLVVGSMVLSTGLSWAVASSGREASALGLMPSCVIREGPASLWLDDTGGRERNI